MDAETAREGWDSFDIWMGNLRPTTQKTVGFHFMKFMEWLGRNGGSFSGMTPDQLVDYQAEAEKRARYHILDLAKRFAREEVKRPEYMRKKYSAIRSFFMNNRAELPAERFRANGDRPKVVGTLTPGEIKLVVLSSNRVYRAVFLCMFQSGMDKDMFDYWNLNGWEKLREDLRGDAEVIKIDLPGRKQFKFERPYYTFIGSDAIGALREWIRHRPPEATAIFTSQFGQPISKPSLGKYWMSHLRRLGIVKKTQREGTLRDRYGKNLHEMRDVFRSLWSNSHAKDQKGEYFMGHVIDTNEYDKSFRDVRAYRKAYLRALPMLQIMSSGRPFGRVDEEEIEDKFERQEARIEDLERTVENLTMLLNRQGLTPLKARARGGQKDD